MDEEDNSDIDLTAKDHSTNEVNSRAGKKASDLNAVNQETENELTPELLDDIIERLVYHDKYPGYTINENKQTNLNNLPYILKEKEIRLLIAAAENVFKD
jgi:hypothetical protein